MLKELTAEQFDAFSSKHPYTSYQQSSAWAELKAGTGWGHVFWGYEKDGELVAAAMVLYKTIARVFKLFYSPRGFLIDFRDEDLLEEFTQALVSEVKKRGGMCLKLDPYVDTRKLDADAKPIEPGYDNSNIIGIMKKHGYKYLVDKDGNPDTTIMHSIYVLDLEGHTEKSLLSSFRTATRYAINNCKRNGVKVRQMSREELPVFKEMMEKTSERRGFADRSLEYYQMVYDAFAPKDQVRFMCAELDLDEACATADKRVADNKTLIDRLNARREKNPEGFKSEGQLNEALAQTEPLTRKAADLKEYREKYGKKALLSVNMDFLWGPEIVVCYGGNDEELLKFDGQMALYWHMICEGLKRGDPQFNFYGIPADLDKSKDQSGVYLSKRGFNGRVEYLIGEFDYVINPLMYRLYVFASNLYFRSRGE